MKMRVFATAAALVAAFWAAQSQASTTYFGNSMGKACFDAVNMGTTSRKDLELCSEAIRSGTLSGKDLPATFVNRGIILMRMERFRESIEDYESALRLDPDLAEAKINMGAALIGLRQYANAIDFLQDGLSAEPISAHVAHYNLGIAHELIGDYQSARVHYADALAAAPQWSPALRKLESLPLPTDATTPAQEGEDRSS